LPVLAAGVPPPPDPAAALGFGFAFVGAAPVVDAGAFFLLSGLSGLAFGPAVTLAVRSNEENTTIVEVARMCNLQPALAGYFARTSRRREPEEKKWKNGCEPALFPLECCSCSTAIGRSQAGAA
jgi:hypothetical protein